MSARFYKAALAASLSLLFAEPAFAHHPGGPGNTNTTGPINTLSGSTGEEGSWGVGLSYEFTDFDALSDGVLESEAEAASLAGQHAHVHSLDNLSSAAITLSYGIRDYLNLSVRVPYATREGVRTGHFHGGVPEVESEGGSSGIGDISALLQWQVLHGETTEVSLFGGVEAPTGTDDDTNDLGEVFASEFQPSSGAWDWTLGAAVTRHAGQWSFDASALYTFAGDNDEDDNLGDRIGYGVAASYRVLGGIPEGNTVPATALDLVLELNGEWHDEQAEGGEIDPNSGGHVLFLSPGVRVTHGPTSGYLTIGAPVVSDMNGVQAEPNLRVTAGISRRF